MDFYEYMKPYRDFDFRGFFEKTTDLDIKRTLAKDALEPLDFLTLLSPRAVKYLEPMAQRANALTVRQFGKVILLFAPLYLANHCVNKCAYCSFKVDNPIGRDALSLEQLEVEAKALAATGIRDILFLTGESRKVSPPEYMRNCVQVLKKYFSNISLEVYRLETEEYAMLNAAGVDGFTMFQECYHEGRYGQVHLGGPKRNYRYRLDGPERACKAGMRTINIGALLGLYEFASEAFFTGLHAYYLQRRYAACDIAVSLPRLRPYIGSFAPYANVTDRDIVQEMLALRLFLPRVGITVSTREQPQFRDRLIGLGVTKMSAGSSTEVGGYSNHTTASQFEIADTISVAVVAAAICGKGWLPVFKDWQTLAREESL